MVEFVPGDDVVEWSEGNRIAKKLQDLRRLRSESSKHGLAPACFQFTRAIINIERGIYKVKGSKESRTNAVFARCLRAEAALAAEVRDKNIKKNRGVRMKKLRKAKVEKAKKRKKELLKFKKEADAKALLKHPIRRSSDLLGTKKTFKAVAALHARIDCLERLYVRSPPLPLSLAGRDAWVRFRNSWAKIAAEKYGEKTGLTFMHGINDCLEQLGGYYAGKTDSNKGASYRDAGDLECLVEYKGDKTAFETYVKKCTALPPKSVLSCLM